MTWLTLVAQLIAFRTIIKILHRQVVVTWVDTEAILATVSQFVKLTLPNRLPSFPKANEKHRDLRSIMALYWFRAVAALVHTTQSTLTQHLNLRGVTFFTASFLRIYEKAEKAVLNSQLYLVVRGWTKIRQVHLWTNFRVNSDVVIGCQW